MLWLCLQRSSGERWDSTRRRHLSARRCRVCTQGEKKGFSHQLWHLAGTGTAVAGLGELGEKQEPRGGGDSAKASHFIVDSPPWPSILRNNQISHSTLKRFR